ncbi:hypothetical protein [Streptomyces hoynatensis]|nr:hypothetical protein [Streptomyces hoynatensis]
MTASQREPAPCNFCDGDGMRYYSWAYVPGADPFSFRHVETLVRSGSCRNCRGTGRYDATRDPTLDLGRDEDRSADPDQDLDAEPD